MKANNWEKLNWSRNLACAVHFACVQMPYVSRQTVERVDISKAILPECMRKWRPFPEVLCFNRLSIKMFFLFLPLLDTGLSLLPFRVLLTHYNVPIYFHFTIFIVIFSPKQLKSAHDSPSLPTQNTVSDATRPLSTNCLWSMVWTWEYFRITIGKKKNQWKIWHYQQPCLYKDRKRKSPCSYCKSKVKPFKFWDFVA